jgi:hypothetical protein
MHNSMARANLEVIAMILLRLKIQALSNQISRIGSNLYGKLDRPYSKFQNLRESLVFWIEFLGRLSTSLNAREV